MNLVGTLSNPVKTEVNVNANVNILILTNNRETRGWMAWSLIRNRNRWVSCVELEKFSWKKKYANTPDRQAFERLQKNVWRVVNRNQIRPWVAKMW